MMPNKTTHAPRLHAADGILSALTAQLHFRRTGQRWKPRLVAVNPRTVLSLRPRPALRLIEHGDAVAKVS